jgi:hypothetical protein
MGAGVAHIRHVADKAVAESALGASGLLPDIPKFRPSGSASPVTGNQWVISVRGREAASRRGDNLPF